MPVYCTIYDADKKAAAHLRHLLRRYWPEAQCINGYAAALPGKDVLVAFVAFDNVAVSNSPVFKQYVRNGAKLVLIARTGLLAPVAVKLHPYDYWIKPVTKEQVMNLRQQFQ